MTFEPIDLTRSSAITHSLRRWARGSKPFLSILHVAFSGKYRDGSGGRPDAYFIRSVVHTAYEIWSPSGIVIDFSDLTYEWGDEMDVAYESPGDIPTAIIVGPRCVRALSTLRYGLKSERSITEEKDVFRAFPDAIAWLRSRVVEDWNALVRKHPEWSPPSDMIAEKDL